MAVRGCRTDDANGLCFPMGGDAMKIEKVPHVLLLHMVAKAA
jgi:hypothetical protein